MTSTTSVSKLLTSKGLILVLVLGNVALGFTIVVQNRIIEGQSHLIHLLYQDAVDLAGYRIAAARTKALKP